MVTRSKRRTLNPILTKLLTKEKLMSAEKTTLSQEDFEKMAGAAGAETLPPGTFVVLMVGQLNELMGEMHKIVEKAGEYNIPGIVLAGMFQQKAFALQMEVHAQQVQAMMNQAKKESETEGNTND